MVVLRPAFAVWSPFSKPNKQQAKRKKSGPEERQVGNKSSDTELNLVLVGNWNVPMQSVIVREMGRREENEKACAPCPSVGMAAYYSSAP